MSFDLRKLKANAVILADGFLGKLTGKTCNILVMYSGWRRVNTLSVIDTYNTGRDAGDVIGIGKRNIPVISRIEDALKYKPDTLIIGIAPVGGKLPEKYRKTIIEAIQFGLNIWSGLHIFLSNDPEISKLAEKYNVQIIDFRKPPKDLRIWSGKVLKTKCARVLVAGTDCSVGKNVTTIELCKEFERRGYKVGIVGTGQTMLMVGADTGAVIDAIPADFTSGEVEKHIIKLDDENYQIVLIEGQASLLHPAYSQVTLAIYYGSMPHCVILCHDPWRKTRESFDYLPMESLSKELQAIRLHIPNTVVSGISIMGWNKNEIEIKEKCRLIEETYGITAADPRKNIKKLCDSIIETLQKLKVL